MFLNPLIILSNYYIYNCPEFFLIIYWILANLVCAVYNQHLNRRLYRKKKNWAILCDDQCLLLPDSPDKGTPFPCADCLLVGVSRWAVLYFGCLRRNSSGVILIQRNYRFLRWFCFDPVLACKSYSQSENRLYKTVSLMLVWASGCTWW